MNLLPSHPKPVPIYTPGLKEQVKVKCLAQGHNTLTTQGSNTRPWDQWSRAQPLSYVCLDVQATYWLLQSNELPWCNCGSVNRMPIKLEYSKCWMDWCLFSWIQFELPLFPTIHNLPKYIAFLIKPRYIHGKKCTFCIISLGVASFVRNGLWTWQNE